VVQSLQPAWFVYTFSGVWLMHLNNNSRKQKQQYRLFNL